MTVTKILHARQGVETWVTSDGRAYFVQLNESTYSDASTSDLGRGDENDSQVGSRQLVTNLF